MKTDRRTSAESIALRAWGFDTVVSMVSNLRSVPSYEACTTLRRLHELTGLRHPRSWLAGSLVYQAESATTIPSGVLFTNLILYCTWLVKKPRTEPTTPSRLTRGNEEVLAQPNRSPLSRGGPGRLSAGDNRLRSTFGSFSIGCFGDIARSVRGPSFYLVG